MSDHYQRVRVLDDPHCAGCDHISAEIHGQQTWISYDDVANARLVPSDRTDGLETIILSDGRNAIVQSFDLDYL